MFQVPVFLYFCLCSLPRDSQSLLSLGCCRHEGGTNYQHKAFSTPSPSLPIKRGNRSKSKAQRCDSSCFAFWAMGSWWCGWKSKYIMSESVSGTLNKKIHLTIFPLFPSMSWLFLQQALLSQKLKKQTKKKEEQECEPARVRVLLCFALLLFKILCQLHNSLSSPSPIFPHGQLSTIY